MGLNRKVGFLEGLKYQGGGPMLAWILHRLTALGIILFVGLHVIASFFMQQLGSDFATTINIIYESWIFQIIVAFCVIFHALNGLRIVICDLWPQSLMYQREILWLQWFIFVPIYSLTVFILIYINIG
jgi:succinate dehydrogenase / fumarate reductase cytochrome b subunit